MSKLVLVPAEALVGLNDCLQWEPACPHAVTIALRPPITAEEVEGLARVIGPNCYDGPDENGAFSRCVRPLCSCRTLARAVLSHFGAKVE